MKTLSLSSISIILSLLVTCCSVNDVRDSRERRIKLRTANLNKSNEKKIIVTAIRDTENKALRITHFQDPEGKEEFMYFNIPNLNMSFEMLTYSNIKIILLRHKTNNEIDDSIFKVYVFDKVKGFVELDTKTPIGKRAYAKLLNEGITFNYERKSTD